MGAVKAGLVEGVEYLIRRADVILNSRDNKGRTPIMYGSRQDLREVTESLLRVMEVDVLATNNHGFTAADHVREGGHDTMVRLIELEIRRKKKSQAARI